MSEAFDREHQARTIVRRPTSRRRYVLLLAGALVCASLSSLAGEKEGTQTAQDAPAPPNQMEAAAGKPKPMLTFDWLAAGQYLLGLHTIDRMLETEGGRLQSGFLLDHASLTGVFPDGTRLDLAAGTFIADRPKRSEGELALRYRKPGVWSVFGSVSVSDSYFDDQIASLDLAGTVFDRADLGTSILKIRENAELGFVYFPTFSSKIGLKVAYRGVHGDEIPLAGSAALTADGYVFAYPGRTAASHDSVVVSWEGSGWIGSIVGLKHAGSYRLSFLDDAFRTWQIEARAIEGVNVHQSSSTGHLLMTEERIDIRPVGSFSAAASYSFAYSTKKPSFADSLADLTRVASSGGSGFELFRHTVPLTFSYNPLPRLQMTLQAAGLFTSAKAGLAHEKTTGDPPVPSASRDAGSDMSSLGLRQRFELVFRGVPQTTLRLKQLFEIKKYDFNGEILDLFTDPVDESRQLDAYRNAYGFILQPMLSSHLVPGTFSVDLGCRLRMNWSLENVRSARDWIPYGDQRDWSMEFFGKAGLKVAKKVSMVASFLLLKGRRWRTQQTDIEKDADLDLQTIRAVLGIHATPTPWLMVLLDYAFQGGTYEVGSVSFPAFQRISYVGLANELSCAVGLSPISWLGIDASYGIAVVRGTVDTTIQRISADTRFQVHRNVKLGIGYLGRLAWDENASNFNYSGHLFRVMVQGTF
jgi:hypothetical protein